MENNQIDYHVSFFKPKTRRTLKNRNMVLWLVIVWATAVFGFQILLRVIEKPVPEPAYNTFVSVWDNVKADNASVEELKDFANSLSFVIGKVYIKEEYKPALSNAFSWSVFEVADDEKDELYNVLKDFKIAQAETDDILNPNYIKSKKTLEDYIAQLLDIPDNDARKPILPFSMSLQKKDSYSAENMELTEEVMSMYLIHNRSVLTDTIFLGFPFHYFFTAVFLLVLFIGLCLTYCIITDRREAKEQLL